MTLLTVLSIFRLYISLFQKKQKLEFCLVPLVALEGWNIWLIWRFGYLAVRKKYTRVGYPLKEH